MSKYQIDADKFLTYLRTVQPESTKFVFQTFTDDKTVTKALKAAKQRDPLACSFVASPSEALPRLQVLQDKGAGIFVQMNVSTARGKDNVTKLSSYFLDTDGAPIAPIIKAMPKPLMVVASSKGNYHIYWRTEDPLEKFKATQKSLAQSFACDVAMVNLDRVVRIPGTWHLKDKTKPFQVGLSLGEDSLWTAKQLMSHAPAPQATPASTTGATGPMSMAEAMVTTSEAFEMPTVLAEGNRTHHLVSLAGKLVNEGYGAETVKEKIKATMLELLPEGQQPIPDETMEIEIYPAIYNFIERDNRPTELPEPPAELPEPTEGGWGAQPPAEHNPDALLTLEDFIEKFYFIEVGSRIVSIKDAAIGDAYKLEEFKNAFGNRKRGKSVLTKKWLECEDRKTVRDIVYRPNQSFIYNYRGRDVINNYEAAPLKKVETPHPAQLQVFIDHINYMFPNQEDAHVFLSWMAMSIREPEKRIPWAPFIVSAQGVGKGWIAEVLKNLVGRQNYSVVVPKNIKSDFNEYMFEKTVCLIDELKTNGREQFDLVETLKNIITETEIEVNIKFGVKGTYPVYPNILCFSNHINALPIPEGDRRFWVYRVEAPAKAANYYVKLFQWLHTDGPAHLYQWLTNYDLGDLCITAAPAMTAAKAEMVEAFKHEIEIMLTDAIEDREGPFISSVIPADIVEYFCAG